jgi:D-glycero-D-manno-heptose 1,7-bisphosphate phosphatase
MTRLVIFDVDDTLRRTTTPGQPCPYFPTEWELLPNVAATLRRFRWKAAREPGAGLFLGAASNQDHVGYGHLTHDTAVSLIRDALAAALGRPAVDAAIEICPHRLEVTCACRKPAPGMLLALARRFDVRPEETLFVGNAASDREAALRAGTRFRDAADFFAQP